MKAVTEFPSYLLTKGVTAKAALEGKTPEEVQTSLGETFKYEGDKLKHFVAAVDIASQNAKDLRRVLVVSLNEGESAPAKAVKVEEHYYVPEFLVAAKATGRDAHKVVSKSQGGKKQGPKSSPWGMSPEELAAKNKGGAPKA